MLVHTEILIVALCAGALVLPCIGLGFSSSLFEEVCKGRVLGDARPLKEMAGRSKVDCVMQCALGDCEMVEYDGAICRMFQETNLTCDGRTQTASLFGQVNPCHNGGSVDESGQCLCTPDFVGKLCEEDNPCTSDPCQNFGTCQHQDSGSFTCICGGHYFGIHCENARNLVFGLVCLNGGTLGDRGPDDYCPTNTYAASWRLKVDSSYDSSLVEDDTGLNGVELYCHDQGSHAVSGAVSSTVGAWGTWNLQQQCPDNYFIVGFKMRVQADSGPMDDTYVNNVDFRCRGPGLQGNGTMDIVGNGTSEGVYGSWSLVCPAGSAVCGISTTVDQSVTPDVTSVNNLHFSCCAP